MEKLNSTSVEPLAMDIPNLCLLHSISRSLFYKLVGQGRGPRLTKLGARTVITKEDAAEWRRVMAENSPDRHAAQEEVQS